MSLLSYLIPRTIYRGSSRFNRDIRVIEEWGVPRLLVNGSRQSGPTIEDLWKQAIHAFPIPHLPKKPSILVLGVGGGTVMRLLNKQWSEARFTAVDIDATMIDIAKQFFGFDTFPHIQFVVCDALGFIQNATPKAYDCLVIDLFIGRIIPSFVSSPSFYQSLRRSLKPGGILLINYLREYDYQRKSDTLKNELHKQFQEVADLPISNNRFFFARA